LPADSARHERVLLSFFVARFVRALHHSSLAYPANGGGIRCIRVTDLPETSTNRPVTFCICRPPPYPRGTN
jgi:hypothetical protein